MSFCNFHLGNYKQALEEYQNLLKIENSDVNKNEIAVNIAVCMFYLGKEIHESQQKSK